LRKEEESSTITMATLNPNCMGTVYQDWRWVVDSYYYCYYYCYCYYYYYYYYF